MPRILLIGTFGDDVAGVQRLLNYHLPPPRYSKLAVDGKFGPHTRARVMEFQRPNQNYLTRMPIVPADGVVRKPLVIDGIVGPNTGRVLQDVRSVTLLPNTKFTPNADKRTRPDREVQSGFGQNVGGGPAPSPTSPSTQPLQTVKFLTLQAGAQAQLNPWAISPFVVTGQFTWLARNDGKPDFMLTAGGQFSENLGTVNGDWTASVFGQMSLGNLGLQLGPLDFANPFVQTMLQVNKGQPATVGVAIGNQINLSLNTFKINGIEQPRFAVFLNLQEVVNVGTNNGLCSAPATQGMLGLSWTFDPFADQK